MSELAEHLRLIRENWHRTDVAFDSLCVCLVRGHMTELEALATPPEPSVHTDTPMDGDGLRRMTALDDAIEADSPGWLDGTPTDHSHPENSHEG